MKLTNKKAFMLMESLIVATFIMTIFTFIYKNAVPLLGEYTRRASYDDIDSVYAASLFRNVLLRDNNLESLTAGILEGDISYRDITDCSLWYQSDLCNTLKQQLDIVESNVDSSNDGRIYVTRYELSRLKDEVEKELIFQGNQDRGIKTYIEYLPKYTTTEVTSGYRLIIVRTITNTNSETQKYANIEVIL